MEGTCEGAECPQGHERPWAEKMWENLAGPGRLTARGPERLKKKMHRLSEQGLVSQNDIALGTPRTPGI